MNEIIKIGYIFEDIAQANFIKSLVHRILIKSGIDVNKVYEEVLPARGSKVDKVFKEYLRSFKKEKAWIDYDILIMTKDANRKGYHEVKQKLTPKQNKFVYPFSIVFALPDPHVERWYLLDGGAFCRAVGGNSPPELQTLIRKKGFYKARLGEALRNNGIKSTMGGAEYGDDIAREMNLEFTCGKDESFKGFIDDLEFAIKKFTRG